jgi:hypothetical protein
MTVGWTNRANTYENVTLRSIVAMYDPMTTGLSSIPPAGTPSRSRRIATPASRGTPSRSAIREAHSTPWDRRPDLG